MHADLTKVRQSLFNLLSNAAKFTQDGTVTLETSIVFVNGNDMIQFRVSDTGIGIQPDMLDKPVPALHATGSFERAAVRRDGLDWP